MGTHQDTSTLKTLADAVSETVEAENAKAAAGSGSGPNGNGVKVSNTNTGGLDVKAAFDGGGVEVLTKPLVDGSGESKGKGSSLGFAGEDDKKCGYPDGEESGRQNRKGPNNKLGQVNGSVSSEAQMGDDVGEGNGETEDLNAGGRADTMEMDEGNEGSEDVEDMEDHGYSVGDLVWGKIKSHPWWPGQIYDPSDASESAVKYNQRGRLLVAYFGDGSFAWCSPSQLIPFAENFERMATESSSRTFINAVQEAVDEIGRLVELEMSCPCVPEANRNGLNGPLAVNAGIRAGVLVPNGDIGKLLSFRYDPAELLATVENAAVSVSFSSMLDLAILKSSLSAFYRARGGRTLPVYYGPLQIEGLEDENRNENVDASDFSVPIEVPIHRPLEEDWLSSAATGPGNGQPPQDDKIHHRRKQKSVAELMAEDTSAKPKSRKRGSTGEGKDASNSTTKKQKFSDEVENRTGSGQAASGRKRGRKKKDDIPQSGEPAASDAQNGSQTEAQMQERSLSSKLGKDIITIPDSSDGESMKGSEEMSSPRERKKSKYLSPPYTTSHFRAGSLSSKKEELEGGTVKITGNARMGERVSKAAGKLLESPSVGSDNTVEPKLPDGRSELGADLNSQSGNGVQKKSIDTRNVNASVSEVLSGVQTFAVNPLHSWKGRLLDLIRGFILTFRSSLYMDGADYKEYHKKRPDRKKKSLNSEPAKLGNDLNHTGEKSLVARTGAKKRMQEKPDTETSKGKTSSKRSIQEKSNTPKGKTSSKRSIQEKSNTPKSKKAARGSGKKAENEEVDRKSSPASLILTFGHGLSLPSRDNIIRIFAKFGDLDEQETDVFPNSSTVRISYTRRSAAEDAMKASVRDNPFGSADVTFKLWYPSAIPGAVESRRQISSTVQENRDRRVIASESATDETSDLAAMREKLQLMTSMLKRCEGKISTKSQSSLHDGIEVLFEKVKKIADTASN